MSTTQAKTRTITLTGRPPVKIVDDDWRAIAQAGGDSYVGSDCARREQALHQGECDTYSLRVRQHADGRVLVYGVLDAAIAAWGAPAGGESHRGGVLLAAGDDIAAAISDVGAECGMPPKIVRDCIAALPAQEL